jgi:uncharacterized membrane protein YozB (DUF420 family)
LTLYTIVLALHSWLRWLVLALGVTAVAQSVRATRAQEALTPRGRKWAVAYVAALDTQLLLGFVLYLGVSPLAPTSGEAFRNAMKVPVLRFFAVEHLVLMIAAVALAHVASVRARKAPAEGHRRLAAGMGASLLALLAGIPWPLFAHGRPLFRLP